MPFFCIHCQSKIDPKFKACPHCGEPITDFLRRHLDEPVDGKYQLVARLAIGGMGEVYKAIHIHLNSLRVIKLLRAGGAGASHAHERFAREARLATRINNPHVATLFDFATLEDGSNYMVWEFIEGTNLRERIASRGPLAPRYAAGLAIQALEGLEAIHRAGIVHRDVSPENLMITRGDDGEERVKIIDLGIAKSLVPDDTNTQAGFVGKWKYCSPEHLGLLGPGERIDARADVYSFGVVFYEMLAGAPPFQAGSPHEYVLLHSSAAPPPIGETNPSAAVPPELESLVMRALAKDREARFATAAEFASAITAVLPSLPETPAGDAGGRATAEVTVEATEDVRGGRPEVVVPAAPVAGHMAHSRRRPGISRVRLGIAAALVLAVAFALVVVTAARRGVEVPSSPPRRRPVLAAARLLPGHVGINAYPWGEVTRIRNVESGLFAATGQAVTPTSVELEPGVWEITLTHPSFREPLSLEVIVAAGSDQVVNGHFLDPRLAALPDFGGSE